MLLFKWDHRKRVCELPALRITFRDGPGTYYWEPADGSGRCMWLMSRSNYPKMVECMNRMSYHWHRAESSEEAASCLEDFPVQKNEQGVTLSITNPAFDLLHFFSRQVK